jgi:hypothetical protein
MYEFTHGYYILNRFPSGIITGLGFAESKVGGGGIGSGVPAAQRDSISFQSTIKSEPLDMASASVDIQVVQSCPKTEVIDFSPVRVLCFSFFSDFLVENQLVSNLISAAALIVFQLAGLGSRQNLQM